MLAVDVVWYPKHPHTIRIYIDVLAYVFDTACMERVSASARLGLALD